MEGVQFLSKEKKGCWRKRKFGSVMVFSEMLTHVSWVNLTVVWLIFYFKFLFEQCFVVGFKWQSKLELLACIVHLLFIRSLWDTTYLEFYFGILS